MKLPKFQQGEVGFRQMQDTWAAALDPVLSNPLSNPAILKNVSLKAGLNQVPHLLGKKLQGWFVVRQRGPSSFYDNQDSNINPQLTLTLYSSQVVVIDLAVF